MRIRSFAFCLVGLFATGTTVRAADLTVGDPAPKLEVAKFVKGEPVKQFDKGKIYVVEFWATWCGPCRATIPHLTELQKKHKEVTFIGVSVAETDPAEVEPFVKEMGDKMDYRVATDLIPKGEGANAGRMMNNWMEAAGEAGIPCAFIVNGDTKIAWIGHPGSIDKPLEQVINGSYDLQAAIAERKKAAARAGKMEALQEKLAKAGPKMEGVLKILDEAFRDDTGLEEMFGILKFQLLASQQDQVEQAITYGKHLVKDVMPEEGMALNNMAWMIVDPERKGKPARALIEFALELAAQADKLQESKDPATADTYARALFLSGDVKKAAEVQERAVKLSKGTQFETDQSMKDRLEEYRKAARDK